ncbi:hypothetical protein GCM10025787_14710 [Saccharopolyspora rosea]|uniref:Uncharacterized protein n=1 Tax=Saccharopolyspora rosea TaxID=524884 RepID=A0ABW3FVS5_9PSEU
MVYQFDARPEPWLRPHLEALAEAVRAGFRFLHLPSWDDVLAIQGMRVADGAMDVFLSYSATDALAARVAVENLDFHASPLSLWEQRGAVADVLTELLALPPHGAPGAPVLVTGRVRDLWLPGRFPAV